MFFFIYINLRVKKNESQFLQAFVKSDVRSCPHLERYYRGISRIGLLLLDLHSILLTNSIKITFNNGVLLIKLSFQQSLSPYRVFTQCEINIFFIIIILTTSKE